MRSDTLRSDTVRHATSPTGVFVPFAADSLRISGDSLSEHKGYHQTKSPWMAVGLSAVLPGSGQIYNESYWKAPVIWGLGGYWIYEWVKLNNLYKQYQDLYNQSITEIVPGGNSHYRDNRDFYKDERDRFAWYL